MLDYDDDDFYDREDRVDGHGVIMWGVVSATIVLALLATCAQAAWPPVAAVDPVPGATHCALIVDGKQQPDVPVQADRWSVGLER